MDLPQLDCIAGRIIMESTNSIKRPLEKGEKILVPCVVVFHGENKHLIPIIDHLHHDRENGQEYLHYHCDLRFVDVMANVRPVELEKNLFLLDEKTIEDKFRVNLKDGFMPFIEYHILETVNANFPRFGVTYHSFLKNSKLKNVVKNHKCPHRGFDLSQVREENGYVRCPLHGLCFKKEGQEYLLTTKIKK